MARHKYRRVSLPTIPVSSLILNQRHISKPQGLVLPASLLMPDYGAEESLIPIEAKQWEHEATHHLPSF